MLLPATAYGQERIVDSVVPALAYGPACSSSLQLQNLSDRPVVVDLEGHKPGGALVPVIGHAEIAIRLSPRERSSYKLQIEEETGAAWAKVRERVPSPRLGPVVAVSGATECISGNQLKTAGREVVYPLQNPWFSGDVDGLPGALVSLINTSEHAVTAAGCYSSGTLVSTPAAIELRPVCNYSFEVQVPPFGAREFPVGRDGNSHFSLRTRGSAIVLEMLRPSEPAVKLYTVDSTIQFGSEVPAKR
jgi:hypothetical protein